MHKYRLISKKGEGTFSEVLKAQSIKNGKYLAIKCMKNHFDSIDQVNNLREIQALRRLSPNPHIIKLYEVLYDQPTGRLALVFELMDMNIYEHIRGRRHYLPEPRVKAYMWQLIKAMDHMHRNGIFHRDVKPENILITDEVLKVADFGSCRGIYSKQPYTEYISTRWYRAPECLLTDGYYGYKMDMWGVGCVMFEVLALFPLFPGTDEVDQINKIHNVLGTPPQAILDKFKRYASHMDFNFPPKEGTGIAKMVPHISGDCADIIEKLLAYDPEERLSARQALKHPYFREMYKQEMGNNPDDGEKKGFAPFKPQRRRKREKQVKQGKQTSSGIDEDSQSAQLKSLQQTTIEKQKQTGSSPEKGEIKGSAILGGNTKLASQRSVPNKQDMIVSSSKSQNVVPSGSHKSGSHKSGSHKSGSHKSGSHKMVTRRNDDRAKQRNRDRDREERRKRRERRDYEERRERREKSVAPEGATAAGSQVLPPISKAAHGKKTIQSLKIDMAKHRSLGHHRHREGRSHRMPGHRGNSHYGYNHKNYHNPGSTHGKNYHKMKYYSNVSDANPKRSNKPHRSSNNRHSNRGYVGHGHYSSSNSSHSIAPSGSNYHRSKGMFGMASNNRQSGIHAKTGHGKPHHGAQAGNQQYGRFGYQFNNRRGNQSNRYESPYSQRNMR